MANLPVDFVAMNDSRVDCSWAALVILGCPPQTAGSSSLEQEASCQSDCCETKALSSWLRRSLDVLLIDSLC